MPYPLGTLSFGDMMELRGRVRALFDTDPPATLTGAAERVVDFFHGELVGRDGGPACALLRFFKTHRYGDLPDDLQQVVRASVPEPADDLRCLILLATRGEQPEWNSPALSRGHRAIPLVNVEMVQKAPMIAQLITQMGLQIADVVRPDRALLLDPSGSYNVFYVPRALGSPYIVAQEEFVARYGIESVLGFGGLVATGDLFAVIMFSRVAIPPDTAEHFRVIGLNLKVAFLPFARKPLAT